MAKREEGQWLVSNWAIIGRSPEVFNTKMEALQFALRNSEDQKEPFLSIDEADKVIGYRSRVYL
jgi:hypothetical protein